MDPYDLCPCGSGKKLKFCCQSILGEMEKVERLQDNNQPRMALQLLESLGKSHPDNPWIVTRTALCLIEDERSDEAEAVLRPFLREHRDHPLANALYGAAVLNRDGYPEAKRAVHRAFRLAARHFPEIVANLAMNVAAGYLDQAQYLAAREHMVFALRLGSEEQRKRVFSALLEFDGDQSIPYPLRGPHKAPAYVGAEADGETIEKARRLELFGCWREAAERLEDVSNRDAENPQIWHWVGLLRAWDGEERAAAQALHRAAGLYTDFETAVECETLAQLLDQYSPEQTRYMRAQRHSVSSPSQLLTKLDAVGRCVRLDAAEAEESTVARYLILDREMDAESPALTRDETPRHVAQAAVLDSPESSDAGAMLIVSALEGGPLESAEKLLTEEVGNLLDVEGDVPPSVVTGIVPTEQIDLFQNYYFPPKTSGRKRAEIQQEEWDEIVLERWPNMALAGLGGRSPLEAARDDSARVALTAAVTVFDAYCAVRGYILPEAKLFERLEIPVPQAFELNAETDLNELSLTQLRRVDPAALEGKRLEQVAHRALLVRHPAHALAVIRTVIDRGMAGRVRADTESLCAAAGEICRASLRSEESLEWVERGKSAAEGAEQRFEHVLQWKLREMGYRLDDPEDPVLRDLLRELWDRYGSKLPWLRERLTALVDQMEIDAPWESVVVAGSMPDQGGAGVWSPGEASQPAAEGEKKLWLPGDR